MVEFHMIYNPYRVSASLFVKSEGRWIPVNEESGLLRIARTRMQRWLEPSGSSCGSRCYFDELYEASGEREINILFSGTSEDLRDLSIAAEHYSKTHPFINIAVQGDDSAYYNSSERKLEQLKTILAEARQSEYASLLPESVWRVEREILRPLGTVVQFLPLFAWKENDASFEPSAWQMLCLTFDLKTMRVENTRCLLHEFSKSMMRTADRSLERERFLFLCLCEQETCSNAKAKSAVEKLLMEFGLQDLPFALLTKEERDALDEPAFPNPSQGMQEARQLLVLYTQRYCEQYRVRKAHDALCQALQDGKFCNVRALENLMRSDGADYVSDRQIYAAHKWITALSDKLEHLLDIQESSALAK